MKTLRADRVKLVPANHLSGDHLREGQQLSICGVVTAAIKRFVQLPDVHIAARSALGLCPNAMRKRRKETSGRCRAGDKLETVASHDDPRNAVATRTPGSYRLPTNSRYGQCCQRAFPAFHALETVELSRCALALRARLGASSGEIAILVRPSADLIMLLRGLGETMQLPQLKPRKAKPWRSPAYP